MDEVFNSNLSDFLNTQSSVLPDVRLLLDWHLARLSEHEKEVLYWLAINQAPATLEELRRDLLTVTSKARLAAVIQALRQRTVIEQTDGGFFLQPVLIEYLNERIVDEVEGGLMVASGPFREELLSRLTDTIASDIRESRFTILNRHALLKATSRTDVQDTQRVFLVEPLLRRLEDVMGSGQTVRAHLINLLASLRLANIHDGYAAGNILNLLAVGGYGLDDVDFSGLSIWQGVLDRVDLRRVDFRGCRFSRTTFRGSFGPIMCVSWSPDDRALAAGTATCDVLVWDVADRQLAHSLEGHTDWVRAVEFLSDTELVTAGDDGTIRIWRLHPGEPSLIRTIRAGRGWIRALAVDRARRMVFSGMQDGAVLLWNVDSGDVIAEVGRHEGPCLGLHFDSLSGSLVTTGVDGSVVVIHGVDVETPEGTANASPDGVRRAGIPCYTVAASRGLECIVAGASNGEALLWRSESVEPVTVVHELLPPVRSLAMSGDGAVSWVACSDSVGRCVESSDGSVTHALFGHTAAINSIRLSGTESMVATGADDQTVRIWGARTGQCMAVFSGYSGAVRSVSGWGSHVVTLGEDRALRFWDPVAGVELSSVANEPRLSWPISIDPQNGHVMCSSTDGVLRVFDRHGRNVKTASAHRGPIRVVAFSASGRRAATGGADHVIRVWDTRDWVQVAILQRHTDWVRALAFVNDDLLFSSSDDGKVLKWDVASGASSLLPRGARDFVHCLAADNGPYHWLICGSEDGDIEVWNADDLSLIKSWKIRGSVRSIALDAEHRRLMAGGFGKVVHVWDTVTGATVSTYPDHESWVRGVAFADPEASTAVSCGSDGLARLWDVASSSTLRVFRTERPYEGMDISRCTGLDLGTVEKLIALGARMVTE